MRAAAERLLYDLGELLSQRRTLDGFAPFAGVFSDVTHLLAIGFAGKALGVALASVAPLAAIRDNWPNGGRYRRALRAYGLGPIRGGDGLKRFQTADVGKLPTLKRADSVLVYRDLFLHLPGRLHPRLIA